MLTKVYFPRLAVPVSILISNLIAFAIQFAFFLAFIVYFALRGAIADPLLFTRIRDRNLTEPLPAGTSTTVGPSRSRSRMPTSP